jgi:hypothetical protein
MKNKFTTNISSLVLMGMLVATPFAAFAEDGGGTQPKPANATDFCTLINSDNFKALTRYDDHVAKVGDARDNRDTKIEDNRAGWDQKRADHQTNFENKQNERDTKIEGKDLTDAQKAALLSAQAGVQAAVDTKSGDLEAMVTEFRTNMDQIRSEHRAAIDGLLATVKTDLDAAITKAKADCAAGVAPETVKANFQASMKATHEKFVTDRKTVQDQTKADVQVQVQARQDERQGLIESFRASIKSAWESFRSLFGGHKDN